MADDLDCVDLGSGVDGVCGARAFNKVQELAQFDERTHQDPIVIRLRGKRGEDAAERSVSLTRHEVCDSNISAGSSYRMRRTYRQGEGQRRTASCCKSWSRAWRASWSTSWRG